MSDMKTVYNSKYTWFIYLFLLIAVSAVDSNASGMNIAWEPFKANTGLGSHLIAIDANRIPEARDEFVQTDKIIPTACDTAERKK